MPLAWLAAAALSPAFNFYSFGPYDSSVPRPESLLGYAIGDRHTTFREQESTLMAIAGKASNRVKPIEFGKSVEGRPLRVYAISTPANIARLEEIRKSIGALNGGRAANPQELIAKTPAIVWINECIHGNETASFEAGMALVYNLAASKELQAKLKDVVVLVNPVYNPDGHERFVVFYNSFAVGSPKPEAFEGYEPGLIHGRLNHYRFDMNRDRVAMSQDETRQEVAEFLRWNPQVYCDQHGQVETYFMPPNPQAINENVDRDRLNYWTDVFGKATAKAFDATGSTYFIKDVFDFFYAGYLDSWTTLSGAIGMTHETDGGRLLRRTRQDGSLLTMRDGAFHHMTSAIAVIGSAAAQREKLLASYWDLKRKTVDGSWTPVKGYVIRGEERALLRLQAQLSRGGVVSTIQPHVSPQGMASFWGGPPTSGPALVVPLAQAQGRLAKALVERQASFEPEFIKAQIAKKETAPKDEQYPGPEGTEFYDYVGWSLPYAHGLEAYESTVPIPAGPNAMVGPPAFAFEHPVGYALAYTDQDDALAAIEMLQAGIRGMWTTKSMKLDGHEFPAGTFLFLDARNSDGYGKKLLEIANRHGCTVMPLSTSYPDQERTGPGSETTQPLVAPKIGIVFGNGDNNGDFGAAWYLFEREFKLNFTPVNPDRLSARRLADYTVLLVPSGFRLQATDAVKDWVRGGGVLVALGDPSWAVGEGGFQRLETVEGDHREVPVGLFRAEMDPRSFLSYGYGKIGGKLQLAVPYGGSTFYKSRKEGGSVVKFADDPKAPKLLSGWIWPDETEEAMAGCVFLQDSFVGRGHVVSFMSDPTERAMWPGLYKMLLNAILAGN